MTLPTKLFHYSKEKFKLDNTWVYKKKDFPFSLFKCDGLWFSVEDDDEDENWFDFCSAENFAVERLKFKYSVVISQDAKILHLKNEKELCEFSLKYSALNPADLIPFFKNEKNKEGVVLYIDWGCVQSQYDGIVISPYQINCRLNSLTIWYRGWDCSSGCVWNLDKISLEFHSSTDEQVLVEECQNVNR